MWSKPVEFTEMAKTRENVNSSQGLVELFLSLLVKPQPVSSLPSVTLINRVRPSSVQKQRKVLSFDSKTGEDEFMF